MQYHLKRTQQKPDRSIPPSLYAVYHSLEYIVKATVLFLLMGNGLLFSSFLVFFLSVCRCQAIDFPSLYIIWDELSLKTISRYCPFKNRAFSRFICYYATTLLPNTAELCVQYIGVLYCGNIEHSSAYSDKFRQFSPGQTRDKLLPCFNKICNFLKFPT